MENYLNKFISRTNLDSYFVSFEGIEGAGKSTQIERFQKHVESLGFSVHLFREPGGTVFGEKLREAILGSKEGLDAMAECYLFASSRAQLLREKILPILEKKNHVVILDRYIDSTMAYQGIARGIGIETVLATHQYEPLNRLPDITFYLHIDLQESHKRQEKRGHEKDYFESKDQDFYQKILKGYDKACELFKDRIVTVDAKRDVDTITRDINQKWDKFLKECK